VIVDGLLESRVVLDSWVVVSNRGPVWDTLKGAAP
jgi:hypothetical protein